MKIAIKKTTLVVLALAYLVGSAFGGLGHTDFILTSSRSPHQIQTHDCGSHERHKPLGSDDNCPICQRIHQMSSTITTTTQGEVVSVQPLVEQYSSFHHVYTSYFSPFKRGPPSFLG